MTRRERRENPEAWKAWLRAYHAEHREERNAKARARARDKYACDPEYRGKMKASRARYLASEKGAAYLSRQKEARAKRYRDDPEYRERCKARSRAKQAAYRKSRKYHIEVVLPRWRMIAAMTPEERARHMKFMKKPARDAFVKWYCLERLVDRTTPHRFDQKRIEKESKP